MRQRLLLSALCLLPSAFVHATTTAELYNPAWISEMAWTGNNAQSGNYFNAPTGSIAYLEDQHLPWWQIRVAHPVEDYDSSKLPVGTVRMDTALDIEYTVHRPEKSWSVASSPSGINNVYTHTPGSQSQQDRTGRFGQAAFMDLGFHPVTNVMGDIGLEAIGNYDQQYWQPVNQEHRMFNDDRSLGVARAELKYDDSTLMVRGFEGIPQNSWVYQNDLFQLMPVMTDVEYYRRLTGSLSPRGGELRYKSDYGNIDVLGGSELRMGYGPSVFLKYDAPARASWENSLVFRHEAVDYTLNDQHRWTLSYNSSWKLSDRTSSHAGLLFQPFRVNTQYTEVDDAATGEGTAGSDFQIRQKRTLARDAFGATWRLETHPYAYLDTAGAGYTYLGPVAGNKHQVDVDASRMLQKTYTLSGAYLYRQPVIGPVPLIYEGTTASPGALLANPRGPDDPFGVHWDNRKVHTVSLTMVYDPTPETWFFRHDKNILEETNLNPAEDATWIGAVQYRASYYPTNTDRMYYFDEDRHLIYDPIFHVGAHATSYPFSSATGILRWKGDRWRVTADLSGGQALAGNAIAYTAATNFYKPSTTYMQGGVAVDDGTWKTWFRYGQDVWGPYDYEVQQGWTYHKVYQLGSSYIFLKDFESGVRYIGTRMTDEFIGSNMGAFNELSFFLTYHFGVTKSLGKKYESRGRSPEMAAKAIPDVVLNASDAVFSPGGTGGLPRNTTIYPRGTAEAGFYSWKLLIRDGQQMLVKQWEGQGEPPASLEWNGLAADGKPLPAGFYRATLSVRDRAKSEAMSLPQTLEIRE